MPQAPIVPSFFLFGEPPKTVEHRFLHLEALEERSRPNAWNIRPHSHANLSHVLHIEAGGGRMRVEDSLVDFRAPCVLLAPAGRVHGFAFDVETIGRVLTISNAYLHDLALRDRDLGALFAGEAALSLPDGRLAGRLDDLGRELVWSAPGHAAAVEAHLLAILVEVLRLAQAQGGKASTSVGPHAELVARFRELVERRYRSGDPLETYASDLGVTVSRLRDACLKIAAAPPARLIHDRLLLEARRALLYSNMTVSEAAYYLGFNDPAYFSRFFAKAAGQSPRAYRASRAA